MREISWPAENRSASQEGLCSMSRRKQQLLVKCPQMFTCTRLQRPITPGGFKLQSIRNRASVFGIWCRAVWQTRGVRTTTTKCNICDMARPISQTTQSRSVRILSNEACIVKPDSVVRSLFVSVIVKVSSWHASFTILLRALCYNCYKLDQQNAHTSMLQLLMLPNCYMFRPSPAHHHLLQLYKPSLYHTVICNIRHCGDIISVWFTEVNTYTANGAHHRLGCVQVRPEICSSFGKLIIIEFCWSNM
jgi:hypothetical protein